MSFCALNACESMVLELNIWNYLSKGAFMINTNSFGDTYQNLVEIGSGGGGTVYKAYHTRLQMYVALKKIHSNLTGINTRAEIDILKGNKHQYLPQVLDFIENENGIYTVMEFIEGNSLKEYLDTGRPIDRKYVVKWFKQLCEALQVLHGNAKPIIHGDIKPANVMITPAGNVCLIDFNIASIFEGNKTIISGYTPGYAAPEQMDYYRKAKAYQDATTQAGQMTTGAYGGTTSGSVPSLLAWDVNVFDQVVDERTDIYNLGATMFHALTGVKPRNAQGFIPDITTVRPDLDQTLAFIVNKCLAIRKEDRYQNVTELLNALQNLNQSNDQYKKLVARQNAIRGVLLAGTIAFSFLAIGGLVRMNQEKSQAYMSAISQMESAITTGDALAMEAAFEKAVSISPEDEDSYIIKTKYYIATGQYQVAEDFLTNIALPYVKGKTQISNLYLMLGNCYMYEGSYENAILCIEQAMQSDSQNPDIYRDYAVCLANIGQIEKAKAQLDYGTSLGLSSDGISYANGEIAYISGDYANAESYFSAASGVTNDEYMLMRCYLKLMQCSVANGKSELTLNNEIAYADQGLTRVTGASRIALLSSKAVALSELGELTGNAGYNSQAIDVFNTIINEGMGTYQTHLNIVSLYQRNGQFDLEEAKLKEMQVMFGEDYHTYMYLAFMELSKQEKSSSKSYGSFKVYYEQANQLYSTALNGNKNDPQMTQLEQYYSQLQQAGML